MDRISNLPDDLLLKIVSSLPTKNVAATMVLSKRWRNLWPMLPELDFDDVRELEPSKYERFMKFVDRSMVLNTAPVLEALKFVVGPCSCSKDMATWIRIGVARKVRDFEIRRCDEYFHQHSSIKLPKTLYTYEKLVCLKLIDCLCLDVPITVSLPSLKTLHLICVEHKTGESLPCLLSGCPVLEDLVLDKTHKYYFPFVNVAMRTLQRLSIVDTKGKPNEGQYGIHMIVINVPSLKYLDFVDYYGRFYSCGNMREVVEAHVRVVYESPARLLSSLPSVKHLCLCLTASMIEHHIGFDHLVHLELCPNLQGWWDLLNWMLESSPKLQVLEISECDQSSCYKEPIKVHWTRPSSVPECLMLHLHTFRWNDYRTGGEEKKIVAYILENATQLKIVGISPWKCNESKGKRSKKDKELASLLSLPTASSSCQLRFGNLEAFSL